MKYPPMVSFSLRNLLVLLSLAAGWPLLGQTDSLFSLTSCTSMVRQNHPFAIQAGFAPEKGRQALRMARGGFDPVFSVNYDDKFFEDKNYFRNLQSGFNLPTQSGIALRGLYSQSSGNFLNPERTYPQEGLWTAGAVIPLGQGLFIDDNRAALRQAKIQNRFAEAEQQKAMNDLMLQVIRQYWEWSLAWFRAGVNKEVLDLAQVRFEGVVASFREGDRAAIDTVEAFIQVQSRQLIYEESLLQLQNEAISLSNFLWDAEGRPYRIPDGLKPEPLESEFLQPYLPADTLGPVAHPDLLLAGARVSAFDIQRKLAADKLKPRLNVQYNFLTANTDAFYQQFNTDNYRWGLEFAMPLFLRRERARYQLSKIQLRESELFRQQRTLDVRNNIRLYGGWIGNLNRQIRLASDVVEGSQRLLNAEVAAFDAGESSIFLINTRESMLAANKIKLLDLRAKLQETKAASHWAAGVLFPAK
jgi:outer membrane protein TolC